MTLNKGDAGPSHCATSTSTSSLSAHSSPGATIPRAETTAEPEFSSNTLIAGGTFVFQAQTTERRTGMRKLRRMIAPGAFHNSAERYDPPKCHPKTREAVLKEIMDWVQGLEDLERRCYFMWLYGPAGAGKSAIAQTIAELCYELKLLAASFFFSRTAAGRNDDSHLIATLTYQLCLAIPEIRTYVEDAVELDPNIFSLSPEDQLRKLIIEPFSHFHDNLDQYHDHTHPKLIIIDGLDECASVIYVQHHVLQILAENLPIPMLFLVASRPEPHIRGFFTAESMASITTTLALDDSYLPDIDIKLFLEAKFDVIKRDHLLRCQLPESWPSTDNIDRLVRKSSGQFIYASTVIKYVESPRHWPTDRLEIIFGIISRGKDTPFADLDALYTFIFSSVEDINKVLEVFSVLLLVKTSIFSESSVIEGLLGLRRGDLKITLMDLHSILDIPDAGEIRVLHASLGDFLLDQTRSGDYHINQGRAHANLVQHLMRCISQQVTGNRSLSILRKLSSAIFTVHCTLSYPTVELLDALWSFNTSAFWALYYQRFMYGHIRNATADYGLPEGSRASLLSDFFTWLKSNGSNIAGRDLYSHYTRTWGRYVRHSLMQLSLGPLERQYIVFFILPQFRNSYHAQDVFTWKTFGAGYRSLSNISSTLKFHDGDSRYDVLLAEFFSDPTRSGPFYLDGNKYASFAITFTKYLIASRPLYSNARDWEVDLSSLSILLPKASYSTDLAYLLDSKLLSLIKAERPTLAPEAAVIIKAYRRNPHSSDDGYADGYTEVGELNPSGGDSIASSSKLSPVLHSVHEIDKERQSGSALENPTIRNTQGDQGSRFMIVEARYTPPEAPNSGIHIARHERPRENHEGNNGDAVAPERHLRPTWNMGKFTTLIKTIKRSLSTSTGRAAAHPPTIGPMVAANVQHVIAPPPQAIHSITPNNHVNVPQAPLAPLNEPAGPINMQLLPAPTGGFPPIRGLTAMDVRTNVGPNSLALWEKYQGAAVFAYIPYDKPEAEAESSSKVMKIRKLIQSVFNAPELLVTAPQYINAGTLDRKPIYPFFVGSISNDQAQVLLDRICWSTPAITFFTAPFTPFVSDFVMTLQNIPLSNTHENELAIAQVVKDVLLKDTTLHHFLTKHHDALPEHSTFEEAVNRISDSVRATGLDTVVAGEPVTLFNIFATPPSHDSAATERWVLQLRSITYVSQWGAHTAKEPFNCNCCQSIDHPVELCPFRTIPGFPSFPVVPH